VSETNDEPTLQQQKETQLKALKALHKYVKVHRNGIVPPNCATELIVGDYAYAVASGDAIWLKKDSETEFYITLEEQNTQLTCKAMPGDEFRITRRALGGSGYRRVRRVS